METENNSKSESYLEIAEFKDRFEILANVGNNELEDFKVDNSIKQISKIIKKADRRKKDIIIITNLDLKSEEKLDNKKMSLIASLNACKIKNKNERLEFIYKACCNYLDNEFRNKNICEFENDQCFVERGSDTFNGCCHKFSLFRICKEDPVCEYQKNKICVADCLGCKLFTCVDINKKGINYTCYNVALIKYFFNFCQKIVIRCTVFSHKDKVLRRLRFFS